MTSFRLMLNKVPEVTLTFWLIKMMSTTVGETVADFLIFDVGLGLVVTSAIMGGLLVAVLLLQLSRRRYVPANYWLAVVMISVVGTLVSDYLVDEAGVTLVTTTVVFSMILAAVFVFWFATERTLSIHAITTTRRELFYWAAILVTFALGTASGDLVAEGMQFGYPTAVAAFALLIAAVYVAWRAGLDAVTAFWIAYILTRPFGASVGDLLSQSVADGGLGFGATGTSTLFLALIAIMVVYQTVSERRQRPGAI